MTPAIDVKNIYFSYKKEIVLADISFSIEKGRFFVIIGPNGSGKTTLMKMLSGVEKFKKGKLKLFGRSIRRHARKELARQMAFVPQTIPTDFPFTVTELVLMGRTPYLGVLGVHGEKDRDIAEKAMQFTGIAHHSQKKLNQLSGGERQRVFIARAICQEPDIILLDEPTASLDLAHQINVMSLMEKLKKEKGLTIVMVSHDLNLASMYGDDLLLLKNGTIVKMGSPRDVLTESILKKTYGCELIIDQSPMGDFPRVTLVPGKRGTILKVKDIPGI
ncbi:MAG: ABC transporter ATP-binding protein [Proteobacteria bacterium]|nr:ABC transporter ATP-binding protein [Pseudomonadota bacterium]